MTIADGVSAEWEMRMRTEELKFSFDFLSFMNHQREFFNPSRRRGIHEISERVLIGDGFFHMIID